MKEAGLIVPIRTCYSDRRLNFIGRWGLRIQGVHFNFVGDVGITHATIGQPEERGRPGRFSERFGLNLNPFLRLLTATLALFAVVTLRAQSNYATPYAFTTLAGTAGGSGSTDGVGSAARFNNPLGVAVDGAGNVYVADTYNRAVRKITADGVVTTLAGGGSTGSTDGTGNAARFNVPQGVAVDGAGNVYVADAGNHAVRKITPGGVVTTLANLGSGSSNGTGSFDSPPIDIPPPVLSKSGIAVDHAGNVFVADTYNNLIRKITSDGVVTTLAGANGYPAQFYFPQDVAVDGAGNVYVANANNTIQKISSVGEVTTLAGSPSNPGSADGQGSAAQFNYPQGVAVDNGGNVYVTDSNQGTIRKITSGGAVTTLAGGAHGDGSTNGIGGFVQFNRPQGVAVDGAGNLYVADSLNNTIRLGTTISTPASISTGSQSNMPANGATATLTITSSNANFNYQWRFNGAALSGATGLALTLANVQPANAGLYTYTVAIPGGAGGTSDPTILGVSTTSAVIGSGMVLATHTPHPNGNFYDQVLLTGTAEAITTPGYTVRTSFIDLNDDIVQVEFSGHGTLSLVLDNASGPATPVNYTQASTNYMKGHAGLVITGADETTNVLIFTVGRATAFDLTGVYNIVQPISATNVPANNGSPLFVGHATTAYDGVADIGFIAITSTNGKFGSLRASNANCFATQGYTGIYAPGVTFTGPVFIGDINASAAATPVFIIGSSPDTRITGGDLLQANGQPVKVSGLTQLKFTDGTKSSGATLPAQTNKAVLQQNGTDVTAQIVVNPSP